jgi:hypothetical protein
MRGVSQDMERPVFVVGAPRSGTTLMARILGGHPRIFMPGETHFFDDVFSRRQELGEPSDPEGAARIHARLMSLYGRYNEPDDQARVELLSGTGLSLEAMRDNCRSWDDVLRWFLGVQAEWAGKTRFGNQAPRDLFNVPEVLEFFPKARLVLMVRDPRDFLLSYAGKWRAESGENARRLRRLYHPALASLQWRACMQRVEAVLERVPEAQRMAVRYEDLVGDPEETVRQVCRVVGEDFEPVMLQVSAYGSSDLDRAGRAGVFTTSVGRWRENLPAADVWAAQHWCAEIMERWGYAREEANASPASRLRVLATLPFGAARALWANRRKRGPLLPYLRRRLFFGGGGR